MAIALEAAGIELHPEELTHLMRALDSNHDRRLSIVELGHMLQSHRPTDSALATVLHSFIAESRKRSTAVLELMRRLDSDGSGFIDVDEFTVALKQHGFVNLSDDELAVVFDAFDLNADGKLELSELQSVLEEETRREKGQPNIRPKLRVQPKRVQQKLRDSHGANGRARSNTHVNGHTRRGAPTAPMWAAPPEPFGGQHNFAAPQWQL